jgi:hypothetical protein
VLAADGGDGDGERAQRGRCAVIATHAIAGPRRFDAAIFLAFKHAAERQRHSTQSQTQSLQRVKQWLAPSGIFFFEKSIHVRRSK